MPQLPASRKWIDIAIVAAVAIGLRLIYLYQFSTLPDWNLLSVDNWYHHNWATAIANGNFWGDTTYFRAPLYAWCLGALYALFSPSILIARLFGLAIGVTSVALTYVIADRISGRRAALVAALIQAAYPVLIMTESDLLLDPLYTLLLQVLTLSLFHWSRVRTARAVLVVSAVAGLAAITRPTIVILLPIIFGTLLWQIRSSPRAILLHSAAVLVGLGVTIGGIFARNLIVADDPVLIASQGGINFYIGNNEAADGLHAIMPEPLGYNWRLVDVTYLAERSAGHPLTPGEISSYWTKAAWNWIADNPGKFLSLTIKRFWFSVGNVEIDNNRNLAALRSRIPVVKYDPLVFGAIFILAALGAFLLWSGPSVVRWLIFGALALTLVNSLFFVNSRFRLPLLPVYFVLAGAAVSYMIAHRGIGPRWLRSKLVIIAAAVLTFTPAWTLPANQSPQEALSSGLASYNAGDYDSAREWYQLAFRTDSTYPDVNANLGAAYLRLGYPDSAQQYFEREMKGHPARSLAYVNAAALSLVQEQYDSAGKLAIEAINRKPYDPTAWIVLVRAAAHNAGVNSDSLRIICVRACNTTRNNLDVCLEAAAALDAGGDDEAAIELYSRAVRLRSLPIETDDRMFASGYSAAIAKDRRQRAKANMSLGAIFGRRGEFAQAASYSAASIEVDSTLSGAWVNLISAKAQLGLDNEARQILELATKRFPSDPYVAALSRQFRP